MNLPKKLTFPLKSSSINTYLGVLALLFLLVLLTGNDDIQIVFDEDEDVKGDSSISQIRSVGNVVDIVDGDTLKVQIENEIYTVRLIGIDTPETQHPSVEKQCYGDEATAYLTSLVKGKEVVLYKDTSNTDRYGRLLRYIWEDDLFVNGQIVKNGYGFAKGYPPDIQHQELLNSYETLAKDNNLGLWSSICNYP